MSTLPPKADIDLRGEHVRLVPMRTRRRVGAGRV